MMNCYEAYRLGKYIRCNSFDELKQICNYLSSKGVKWVVKSDIDEESIGLFKDLEFHIWLVKDSITDTLSWTDSLVNKSGCNFIGNKPIKDEDIVLFCNLSF